MTGEHNWSHSYTYKAQAIHRPASIDELRRLIERSARVRALGTRHSFNGIADSRGDLVDLVALPAGFVIDPARRTVTAGASTCYGGLAHYLQSQGWALHNMGSLPHISLAGATATGTHGSGDRHGNLATAVAGFQMVTAGGDLIELRRGDDGFEGMVVGLGAFGILTRITLDIQPSFYIRQDAFIGLSWDTVLANLHDIMSAAYSVSLMTRWSGRGIDRLWLKTRLSDDGPLAATVAHFGATPAPCASATGPSDAAEGLTPFGIPGPWSERLCHFTAASEPGPVEQIQSEYMVPRAQAATALARLRAVADRIDRHLYLSEIRTVAADDLWLSPSYGQDTVAVHFTWKREPDAVAAITAEIEAMLLPLGARPHWGKLMHADAACIGRLYDRLADFRALADRFDPGRKFRNDFLLKHVFG